MIKIKYIKPWTLKNHELYIDTISEDEGIKDKHQIIVLNCIIGIIDTIFTTNLLENKKNENDSFKISVDITKLIKNNNFRQRACEITKSLKFYLIHKSKTQNSQHSIIVDSNQGKGHYNKNILEISILVSALKFFKSDYWKLFFKYKTFTTSRMTTNWLYFWMIRESIEQQPTETYRSKITLEEIKELCNFNSHAKWGDILKNLKRDIKELNDLFDFNYQSDINTETFQFSWKLN